MAKPSHNLGSAISEHWAFLFDADGRIDPYRLSSFFLGDGMIIYAICGTPVGNFPSANLLVAVERGDTFALIADAPIRWIYGPTLPDAAFIIVANFIEQNRPALRAHWAGEIDSIELANGLRRPLAR